MENPFTGQKKSILEKIRESAQARFLAVALMVTPAGLEACAPLKAEIGEGVLSGIRPEDRPREFNLPSYEVMLKELKQIYGEEYVASTLAVHDRFRKKSSERLPTVYPGIDKLDIQSGSMEQLVKRAHPPSWSARVSSIKINPGFKPISYPGLEGKAEYGHCSIKIEDAEINVEFTHESLKKSDDAAFYNVAEVMQSLTHELAHAGDWSSNVNLDAAWALTSLYIVHFLASDPERPEFSYVESIRAKNHERKQEENIARATEYFAELFEFALNMQHAADSKSAWLRAIQDKLVKDLLASPAAAQRNARFISQYLEWTDPGLRPWELQRDKDEILDRMYVQHYESRMDRELGLIDDPAIVSALRKALKDKTKYNAEQVFFQLKRIGSLDESPGQNLSKTKGYYEQIPEDYRQKIDFGSFASIIEAIIQLRARRLRILKKGEDPFTLRYGNFTLEAFAASYNSLSPSQKAKYRPVILGWIQSAQEMPPPR